MDFGGKLSMETTGPMLEGEGDDGGCSASALRLRLTPPLVDFDNSLSPMTRCRSNTWPCRPSNTTAAAADDENRSTPTSVDGDQTDCIRDGRDPTLGGGVAGGTTRKAAARRNAWGNLSYADLITRAIESSPEKRLTLSQIYSWMVENVPFFKDKGDSNSSAGWKNSIRHNLSLHSRFMRVQNESTGKSSWWVINPDVKHLKTPRRRAATMDNTKVALQHRRNRLKGSGLTRVASSEHPLMAYAYDGSSSDHLDAAAAAAAREHISPEMLGLASQNYRVRSSSNASSIGRLSPIPATAEHDVGDSHFGMPLPSSALSWKGIRLPSENCAETLSESLASIFVEDVKKPMLVGDACHGNIMISDSNVMIQNGSTLPQSVNSMTPNRRMIMSSSGANVLSQNGSNIVAQNGSINAVGPSRNLMGLNGAMLGLSSYSHNPVGMECSMPLPPLPHNHHMWPVYHTQQSNNMFPSLSNSVAAEVSGKRGLYDGDAGYSVPPSLSHSGVLYYNDGRGNHPAAGLCRSASDVGFSQFGVSNVSSPAAPQYGSTALNDLMEREPKSTSCFYATSNGDHATDKSRAGMLMDMTPPLIGNIKAESGPFSSDLAEWHQDQQQPPHQQQQSQQQQQQQQSSRLPLLGQSLGPIDLKKLIKILAEKPHLKEKMLQLIQQKRQQLTLQQQQQLDSITHPSETLPSYMSATAAMSRLADPARPKQSLAASESQVNQRLPTTNAAALNHGPESSMPVDLDLDFDVTPAINCDIDQVIQHEMTFGELDFSLDQLQVTQSGSDMDYSSFHF